MLKLFILFCLLSNCAFAQVYSDEVSGKNSIKVVADFAYSLRTPLKPGYKLDSVNLFYSCGSSINDYNKDSESSTFYSLICHETYCQRYLEIKKEFTAFFDDNCKTLNFFGIEIGKNFRNGRKICSFNVVDFSSKNVYINIEEDYGLSNPYICSIK